MFNFFTDSGTKVPTVTAEQMQEIDRIAIEDTGPNLFQMMENAGRNLALLSIEFLGKNWDKAKIVILGGTGGNGGGGICAACHLANRNAYVKLCLSKPEKLAEIPRFQFKVYRNTAGKTIQLKELSNEKFDLIIDAVIGYSLKAAPTGVALELIRQANQAETPILSLDIPSGVDSTTGETPGEFIRANWTMTLALPKSGLNPENAGEIFLADIGIPATTFNRIGLSYISPYGRDFYVRLKQLLG